MFSKPSKKKKHGIYSIFDYFSSITDLFTSSKTKKRKKKDKILQNRIFLLKLILLLCFTLLLTPSIVNLIKKPYTYLINQLPSQLSTLALSNSDENAVYECYDEGRDISLFGSHIEFYPTFMFDNYSRRNIFRCEGNRELCNKINMNKITCFNKNNKYVDDIPVIKCNFDYDIVRPYYSSNSFNIGFSENLYEPIISNSPLSCSSPKKIIAKDLSKDDKARLKSSNVCTPCILTFSVKPVQRTSMINGFGGIGLLLRSINGLNSIVFGYLLSPLFYMFTLITVYMVLERLVNFVLVILGFKKYVQKSDEWLTKTEVYKNYFYNDKAAKRSKKGRRNRYSDSSNSDSDRDSSEEDEDEEKGSLISRFYEFMNSYILPISFNSGNVNKKKITRRRVRRRRRYKEVEMDSESDSSNSSSSDSSSASFSGSSSSSDESDFLSR